MTYQTPESGSAATPERTLPVSELVDWVNSLAAENDTAGEKLREFTERNPDLRDDPRITFAVGRVTGIATVLVDFQGLLIGSTHAQAGRLDSLEALLAELGDGSSESDNTIDK